MADGAVRGMRTGDKGRGRQGEELPTFEPGAELTARATVLADGVQGMLSGAAVEHFGLQPENPQIYALGVKEVWRVERPLERVVHTLGWPLKPAGALPRVRRHVRLPDGPRHALPRDSSSASTTPTPRSRCTTCCRRSSCIRSSASMLEGGERVAWGAKAIPEGGFWSLPTSVSPSGRACSSAMQPASSTSPA